MEISLINKPESEEKAIQLILGGYPIEWMGYRIKSPYPGAEFVEIVEIATTHRETNPNSKDKGFSPAEAVEFIKGGGVFSTSKPTRHGR